MQDFAPVVSVIMGSDSDLPTMKTAARILRDFGVPFEVTIVSAHRTPDRLFKYAKSARSRGLKVRGCVHLVVAQCVLCVFFWSLYTTYTPASLLFGHDALMRKL